MSQLATLDPDFARRVETAFARQPFMRTIGASLVCVRAGEVEIALRQSDALHQHHGFVHAAALTAIVDSACGFAAQTLMPPDREVLTVEFKANFLAPARTPSFLARGRVKRPGQQIFVVEGEVFGVAADGARKPVVAMLATMMGVAL